MSSCCMSERRRSVARGCGSDGLLEAGDILLYAGGEARIEASALLGHLKGVAGMGHGALEVALGLIALVGAPVAIDAVG